MTIIIKSVQKLQFDFMLLHTNMLACYLFLVGIRKHETSGSEAKDFNMHA